MLTKEIYNFFMDRGEHYGAGYYEEAHNSPLYSAKP